MMLRQAIKSSIPVLAAVALILISASSAKSQEKSPPNVVLIISDDQGWTDYGFMQHPHIQTPNLDKLASQSLVFRRGYVPSPLCCPSLASIITGLYPHQHKITSNDPPIPPGMKQAEFEKSAAFRDGREVMNRHMEAVPTLPRLLAERGYLSLQTGKWWQGSHQRGGFTNGMTKGLRHGDDGLVIGRKTMQPIYDFIQTAQNEKKPFFLWYASMMPHEPHNPPERILNKYKDKTASLFEARYWGMVEWFDETCGELLKYLDEQKLADNTIVFFLTDNGWIQNPAGNGSVRSKREPYEGGVRTPILLRWPAKVKPQECEEFAMSIDIAATILAALGKQPTKEMQGINLLDETARKKRKTIFGECFTHNAVDLNNPERNLQYRWAIDERWKLILPQEESAKKKAELYDIVADPHEKKDLIQEAPEKVEALRRKLDAWWKP
jgi:arylsulfatase A-like enzyme